MADAFKDPNNVQVADNDKSSAVVIEDATLPLWHNYPAPPFIVKGLPDDGVYVGKDVSKKSSVLSFLFDICLDVDPDLPCVECVTFECKSIPTDLIGSGRAIFDKLYFVHGISFLDSLMLSTLSPNKLKELKYEALDSIIMPTDFDFQASLLALVFYAISYGNFDGLTSRSMARPQWLDKIFAKMSFKNDAAESIIGHRLMKPNSSFLYFGLKLPDQTLLSFSGHNWLKNYNPARLMNGQTVSAELMNWRNALNKLYTKKIIFFHPLFKKDPFKRLSNSGNLPPGGRSTVLTYFSLYCSYNESLNKLTDGELRSANLKMPDRVIKNVKDTTVNNILLKKIGRFVIEVADFLDKPENDIFIWQNFVSEARKDISKLNELVHKLENTEIPFYIDNECAISNNQANNKTRGPNIVELFLREN